MENCWRATTFNSSTYQLNHSCVHEEKPVSYTDSFPLSTGGLVWPQWVQAVVISSETSCCFQRPFPMSDVWPKANQTDLCYEKDQMIIPIENVSFNHVYIPLNIQHNIFHALETLWWVKRLKINQFSWEKTKWVWDEHSTPGSEGEQHVPSLQWREIDLNRQLQQVIAHLL